MRNLKLLRWNTEKSILIMEKLTSNGIRPFERNKGYGAKQLSLVLKKAKELGIGKVMISCDKDNLASAQVAINNGGRLTFEGYDEEDGEIRIYWIDIF